MITKLKNKVMSIDAVSLVTLVLSSYFSFLFMILYWAGMTGVFSLYASISSLVFLAIMTVNLKQ